MEGLTLCMNNNSCKGLKYLLVYTFYLEQYIIIIYNVRIK